MDESRRQYVLDRAKELELEELDLQVRLADMEQRDRQRENEPHMMAMRGAVLMVLGVLLPICAGTLAWMLWSRPDIEHLWITWGLSLVLLLWPLGLALRWLLRGLFFWVERFGYGPAAIMATPLLAVFCALFFEESFLSALVLAVLPCFAVLLLICRFFRRAMDNANREKTAGHVAGSPASAERGCH